MQAADYLIDYLSEDRLIAQQFIGQAIDGGCAGRNRAEGID
jgi:hypothetical protein